ncbi:MAG: RluA family pseudouridine synthase [Paludibacteraceae bacterium]|nr:RluA family pseudouridine synthase [Paludibacteraceae bacterium]MBN2787527.1 RluA family pseudouridine synthase [Paludibacteraceae bacterium]
MATDFLDEQELEDPELSETPRELFEHHRFVVDKGQSMVRIDKYLVNTMPDISRNRIQDAAEAKCILVNEKPVKSNYRVKPLDVISIQLAYPPNEFEIIPQNIPINIVYEDADLIVINKTPGLVVHPGFGNFEGTLLNALAWHMKDQPDFDVNNPNIGLVHRIDKDTSGLLLIAKNEDAKTKLGKQFFDKTTHRRYVALVWGNMQNDEDTIIGNIGRDPKDRMQMTIFPPDSEQGKYAVTHYKVLERLGYVTLVECRLETGRTHQIRAHMKHIGHVLFNDARYGGNEVLRGTTFAKYKAFVHNCFQICPRQALHAKELGFVHPSTGEKMFFDSDLPIDMQQLIEKWRGYIASRDIE